MDDDFRDLEEALGDDYGFGYDDSLGDPNVKPRRPPAPKEAVDRRTDSSLVIEFPAQQQFLDALKVQVVMVKSGIDPSNPFANFVLNSDNRVYKCSGDPKTCTTMLLDGLLPGTQYFARLVAKNPSGAVAGVPSQQLMTMPRAPAPPTLAEATADTITFAFPAQGQLLSQLSLEIAPADAGIDGDATQAHDVRKPEKATSFTCTGLISGTKYVVRLKAVNDAGSAVGTVSDPILTLPTTSQLHEDITKRTTTTVGLRFKPHGQSLTELKVEYKQKKGKGGTHTVLVPDPQTAATVLIENLAEDQTYSFALVATNPSGSVTGTPLVITTIQDTPDLDDMSGWMSEVPKGSGKKTLGRRLSMRKQRPKRFFFTLDGLLLTWFTEPHGEEVGFVHAGKVTQIIHDAPADMFELHVKNKQPVMYKVESLDPNVAAEDLCQRWVDRLKDASAKRQPQRSTSSASSALDHMQPTESTPSIAKPAPAPVEHAAPTSDTFAQDEPEAADDMDDDEFGF